MTAGDTRRRILDVARRLSDDARGDALLAGVSLREIASRARLSTGGVLHHFPDRQALLSAVASSGLERWAMPQTLDSIEALRTEGDDGAFAAVEAVAAADWTFVTGPGASEVLRRVVSVWSAGAAAPRGDPVGDTLSAEFYEPWVHRVAAEYRTFLERIGLQVREPLTELQCARALNALLDGLTIQHWSDPGSVRDHLYRDALFALVASMVVPRGAGGAEVDDLQADLFNPPDALSEWPADAAERSRRRSEIVVAVGDLFDAGFSEVSLAQAAHRCGSDVTELLTLFGSVRALAAASFAVDVGAVEEAARSAGHPLGAALERIIEAAQRRPEVAQALLAERLEVTLAWPERITDGDIRLAVPLTLAVLSALVAEAAGDPREMLRDAVALVDTALALAAVRTSVSPSALAARVLATAPLSDDAGSDHAGDVRS